MRHTKMKNHKMLMAALFLLTSTVTFAGDKIGNGGDMCENRFELVRNDISSWIQKGGTQSLKLPSGVSVQDFNSKMLEQISKATVSCVNEKIMVGKAEKTCKNFFSGNGGSQIVCNTSRFMGTSESDQYVLVHHEYAGLAGYEVNTTESSVYSISNQVSGFLVDQVVKKLAIKPVVTPPVEAPKTPCPRPRENVLGLFKVIEDPKSNASEVEDYLSKNLIALDVQNEQCKNVFEVAVKTNKLDVVQFLYKRSGKIDVNAKMSNSLSLYSYALRYSSFAIISYLEQVGGEVHKTDWTPLMIAAVSNKLDVIQSIYNRNPQDIYKKGYLDQDALYVAASYNKLDILNFLISKYKKDINYTWLLKGAAQSNSDAKVAARLIENGANVRGVLSIAARANSVEVVKLLIEAGADVDGEDLQEKSILPLVEAGKSNSWEVSQTLIEYGAQINFKRYGGDDVLTQVISHCTPLNKIACVNSMNLVNLGADVNSKNKYGNSVLMLAAGDAPIEVLKLLIKNGADKNYKNSESNTAYKIAALNSRSQEILNLLSVK